ncbi:hypothetical protein K474DRAFT_736308 [Panus rudis PR-1116 ss-1]|nr:hypothetical protein K474DRAFT_736308 [Panus rudis PR-1116 ss-1]
MMPHPMITFPRPPPTSNILTTSERSKLIRSAAKLGQLLGTTPRIVDDSYEVPIRIDLSPLSSKQRGKPRRGAGVSDENHSDWQSRRMNSLDTVSSESSSSSSSTSSHSSHSSSSSYDSKYEESWRVRHEVRRPPLLKLATPMPSRRPRAGTKPDLETIPGSPPYAATPSSPIRDTETAPPPRFIVPSEASIRREKMRRLTKKLGEGVPVHLVFPPIAESTESDEDEILIHSPTTPHTPDSPASTYSGTASDSARSTKTLLSSSEELYSPRRSNSYLRHEASHQPPRKSSFAKPLPAIPATIVEGKRLVVHYHGLDEHGLDSETFEGLACAGVAPSRAKSSRVVVRKPVPLS